MDIIEIGFKMMEHLKGLSNLAIILIVGFSLFFSGLASLSVFLWKYWIRYSTQIAEERRAYSEDRRQFAIDAKEDRKAIMTLYEENSNKNDLHSAKIEMLVEKMANAVNGSSKAIDGSALAIERNTNTQNIFRETLQLNNELIKGLTASIDNQKLIEALKKTG